MAERRALREPRARFQVKPVQKSSISDEIVQQIIALISRGEIKAGERLPSERELCKKFGAGRSSVREALRCLAIMGILSARVGDGTSVAMDGSKFMEKVLAWRVATEQSSIENLMEIRVALESIGAAGAAQRKSESSLQRLEEVLEKMKAAEGDARRFAEHDLNFHLELARASENELLLQMISMIRGQLERTISKIILLPKEMPSSLREHRAILRAVKKGDAEGARAAMQNHLHSTSRRYHAATP